MGAINQVKAQVFKAGNGFEPWQDGCNPLPFQGVSCDYESQGERWMVPVVSGGAVQSYDESFEDPEQADAFKAVRLVSKADGTIIYILGTEDQWLDACNGCCGETPAMDSVTIPDANLDGPVCCETEITESDCEYILNSAAGEIAAGQLIQLSGSVDGVPFTPVSDAAGFASYAAAITWANSNWSAYGVFTAIKDAATGATTVGIKLTSDTIKNGSFEVSLKSQSFCLTIVAGDKFDTIKHNGVDYPLGEEITVVDATQVIKAIKDYFADGALTAFSALKINYAGTGVPVNYSGTNTRTFASGACS